MTHMTNFRAEDMMKIAHAKDSQTGKSEQPAPEPPPEQPPSEQESGQPPEQDSEEETEQQADEDDDEDAEPVPDGTTAEILSWVGDDQDRAQRALDKEQADEKPRVGLTGELEKVLADEDDEE